MSFSLECKEELCRIQMEKSCCRQSELSALYATLGSLHLIGRGQVTVQFIVESPTVAKRIFTLLQHEMHLTAQLHYVAYARFGGVRKCVLTLGPHQAPVMLTRFSIMEQTSTGEFSLLSSFPKIPMQRSCCLRSYLRGIFLGCGSISRPGHGYRLELTPKDETVRLSIAKYLQKFSLPIRQGTRKTKSLYFWTQAEQIITFLTIIGAHRTVMTLENMRIQREVLERVNRAMNCDNANLEKQMNASDRQLQTIISLISDERFHSLPQSLQEIAKMRIQAPDASLLELGQMLHPPIGKSGVNHRMRRLMQYAQNIEIIIPPQNAHLL